MKRTQYLAHGAWLGATAMIAALAAASVVSSWLKLADAAPLAAAKHITLPTQAQSSAAAAVYRSAVLSNDEWMNSLRSEKSWSGRKSSSSAAAPAAASPSRAPAPNPWGLFGSTFDPDAFDGQAALFPKNKQQAGGNTYRTVCVRLCDGYFFPISFATTRDRFGADEDACQSRCASGATLYVYRNPGEDPEHMVDLSGHAYSKLKTAFLFRTAYDASCKCTAHPWEQEARLKHRIYALEADRKKGSRTAVAELKALKSAATKSSVMAEQTKSRTSSRSAASAAATSEAAGVGAGTAPQPPAAKLAVPLVEDPLAAKLKPKGSGNRVAAADQSLLKPMRLGAVGSPGSSGSVSSGSGDWKKKAFSNY